MCIRFGGIPPRNLDDIYKIIAERNMMCNPVSKLVLNECFEDLQCTNENDKKSIRDRLVKEYQISDDETFKLLHDGVRAFFYYLIGKAKFFDSLLH